MATHIVAVRSDHAWSQGLPVSAAGCSRKGTDLDFASRATDTLEFLTDGVVKERAEPTTARTTIARNMFGLLLRFLDRYLIELQCRCQADFVVCNLTLGDQIPLFAL